MSAGNSSKEIYLLDITRLGKSFGGLTAVADFELKLSKGEIFGIIGPNGAGKSTILNMIDGSLRPTCGNVFFKGEDITYLAPHSRAKRGIARVFQANILFPNIPVITNIRIGLQINSGKKFWPYFLGMPNAIDRQEKLLDEKAADILKLVGLYEARGKDAASLPHASQRTLCLAIALAVDPSLLLLDEPVAGMTAEEVTSMLSLLSALKEKRGITIIIVEHNMRAVMSLCERIAVINYGVKIADGTPEEVSKNSEVIEAYLGTPKHAF